MIDYEGNKRKAGKNRRIYDKVGDENTPSIISEKTDEILADLHRSLTHVQSSIDSFYNEPSPHRSSSHDASRGSFKFLHSRCINNDYDKEVADLRKTPEIIQSTEELTPKSDMCFEKLRDCVRRQCNSVSPNPVRKVALSGRHPPQDIPSPNIFPPHRKLGEISSVFQEKPPKKNEPQDNTKPSITPFSWREGKKLVEKHKSSKPKETMVPVEPDISSNGKITENHEERISRWSIDDNKQKSNLAPKTVKTTVSRTRNYSVKDVVEYMQRKRDQRQKSQKLKKNQEAKAKSAIKKRLEDLHAVQLRNATKSNKLLNGRNDIKRKLEKKKEAYFRTALNIKEENLELSTTESSESEDEETGRYFVKELEPIVHPPNDKMAELMRQADLIRQRIAKASREIQPLLNKNLSKNSRQNLISQNRSKHMQPSVNQLNKVANGFQSKFDTLRKSQKNSSKYRKVDGSLPLPGSLRDNYNIIDIVSARFNHKENGGFRQKVSFPHRNGSKTAVKNIQDYSLTDKFEYLKEPNSHVVIPDQIYDSHLPEVDFCREDTYSTSNTMKCEDTNLLSSMEDTEIRESTVESLRYSPTSLAAKFSVELTHLDSIDKSLIQLGALRPPIDNCLQKGDEKESHQPGDRLSGIEQVVKELDEAQQDYHQVTIDWLQQRRDSNYREDILSLITKLQSQMTREKRVLTDYGMALLSTRMEMINRKYNYSHLMSTFKHLSLDNDSTLIIQHIKNSLHYKSPDFTEQIPSYHSEIVQSDCKAAVPDFAEQYDVPKSIQVNELSVNLDGRQLTQSSMENNYSHIESDLRHNIKLYDQRADKVTFAEDGGDYKDNSHSSEMNQEDISKEDSYSTKFDSEDEDVPHFDFSDKKEDLTQEPLIYEKQEPPTSLDIVMSELSSNSDEMESIHSTSQETKDDVVVEDMCTLVCETLPMEDESVVNVDEICVELSEMEEEPTNYIIEELPRHMSASEERDVVKDLVSKRCQTFTRHFWPILVSFGADGPSDMTPPITWETENEHLIDDIIMSIITEFFESVKVSRGLAWSWLPRKRVLQERRSSRERYRPSKVEDFCDFVECEVMEILFGEIFGPHLKISRKVDEIDQIMISQLAGEAKLWNDYEESDALTKEGLVDQIISVLVSDTTSLLTRIYCL